MKSLACSFKTHMQQNCLASVTQMPIGMDDVVVYNSSALCLPSWLKKATNSTVAQEAMPGASQDDLLDLPIARLLTSANCSCRPDVPHTDTESAGGHNGDHHSPSSL